MKAAPADEAARAEADRQFHQYIVTKLANKVLLRLAMGLFDSGTHRWPRSSRPI